MLYNKKYVLKEVVHIAAGYPFRGKIPEKPDGSLSILQMKDISPNYNVAWDSLAKVDPLPNRKPVFLKKEDVVFNGRGTRIFAQNVGSVPCKVVAAPQLFVLSPKDHKALPSSYLTWYINSSFGQSYLYKNARGTSILNVTRSTLENFPIWIPSKAEIERISGYINAIKRERELAITLHERRNTLIESILRKGMEE